MICESHSPTMAAVKWWKCIYIPMNSDSLGVPFSFCVRYSFPPSLCLWLLLSWPLYMWSGANTKTRIKHYLSIQLQRAAVSGAQMVELRKIPVTGGSLGTCYDSIHRGELPGTPLRWILKCSVLVVVFFTSSILINFCLWGDSFTILDFITGNNNCWKIFLFMWFFLSSSFCEKQLLAKTIENWKLRLFSCKAVQVETGQGRVEEQTEVLSS